MPRWSVRVCTASGTGSSSRTSSRATGTSRRATRGCHAPCTRRSGNWSGPRRRGRSSARRWSSTTSMPPGSSKRRTIRSSTRGTENAISSEAESLPDMTGTTRTVTAGLASDAPAHDARVQDALYRIASAASAAQDLDSFYAEMHAIVGELMYAENFYIALYDPERDALRYAYNVDTVDPEVLDPKVWHQLGATRLGRGTTAYVLRTGRPFRFDIATFRELERAGE